MRNLSKVLHINSFQSICIRYCSKNYFLVLLSNSLMALFLVRKGISMGIETIVQYHNLVPPEKLLITDEDGSHIPQPTLGPYMEGSSVNISCVSIGGKRNHLLSILRLEIVQCYGRLAQHTINNKLKSMKI